MAEVAAVVRLSPSQVGRIERAIHPSATVAQLARIGAAVGLDVRLRAYPGPSAARDAGQLRLLRTLRHQLDARLRMALEVQVSAEDQRAWDGVISEFVDRPGALVPLDVDSVLYDFQDQLRRLRLKAADSGATTILWVVAASRRNRRVVGEARVLIADTFPVSRSALRALREGRHPGGPSLILL